MEIFLGQVFLVLFGCVLTVLRLKLEIPAVFHRLAEDRDGLVVGDPGAGGGQQRLQLLDQAAAAELIQEFQLIRAFFKDGFHNRLQEILLQIHQLVQVAEGDFRLDHPELGRMGLGVAVFSAEGGPEGIDLREGHGEGFTLQLAGNGQGSLLAEEVLFPLSGLLLRQGRNGEGVAGALRVIAGNQGRMDVNIAPVLEIGVDGHSRHGTYAENSLEQTGPRAEIGDLPQEFHRVTLGLERIILGAVTLQNNGGGLNLRGFRILVAGDDLTGHGDSATYPQRLGGFETFQIVVIHHLGIAKAGSVEKVDEAHVLLLPVIADPTLQGHFLSLQLRQSFFQFPGGDDVHVFSSLRRQGTAGTYCY